MKKRLFYILAGILVLSFFIDKYISNFFTQIRYEWLTNFMAYFTIIGSGFVVLILITAFLFYVKKKNYLLISWLSLGLALLITWILKNLVARVRPEFGLVAEQGFSFPSGHTTAIFSVFPLLYKHFKKFSYYWLGFGILILLSRLYLGVHYFSDVIAGCLVGLIIGEIVLNMPKKWYSKLFKSNNP